MDKAFYKKYIDDKIDDKISAFADGGKSALGTVCGSLEFLSGKLKKELLFLIR